MRRTKTPVRIKQFPNVKIKPISTQRCESGHEFGLDKDRYAQVTGHTPQTIKCPVPRCETPNVAVR